jgi:hypothetical protein
MTQCILSIRPQANMSNTNDLKCSCKECGNHIAFPAQSAGTTIACPHCGEWTELIPDELATPPLSKSKAPLLAMLGILAAFVVVAAAAGAFIIVRHYARQASPPSPPAKMAAVPTNVAAPHTNAVSPKPAPPAKHEKSPDDLKVGAIELEKAKVGSLVYAVGTVTNDSEFQRFGVQIELELYGKNGKKLGLARDYKDVIEPHHAWQFHALIPDPRTDSAKFLSLKED